MYVNVGAKDTHTKEDIPTKTVLKRVFQAFPPNITLYVTDAFGENAGKEITGDSLEIGVKYSVTGPNPYTSRKWYATVERTEKGIKVS